MQFVLLLAASLVPLLPLVAAVVARGRPATVAKVAIAATAVSGISALIASVLLMLSGPASARFSPFGFESAIGFTLGFDRVTAVMSLLVCFLGNAVLRFARNYLAGDQRQAGFLRWLCATIAAVLTLVVAGNLLLFFAAWVATSLSLHVLLLHYPERPGAVFAARKKFVISRIADLAMAVALLLTYQAYGTFEFDRLFAAASGGNTHELAPILLLLAFAAMLKSAQFPFHSWLPDTMETPTPVSALMHAGIINAGGFLVIRLSPLFAYAPHVLEALAVVGMLTAAFGATVMLAQTSVKRALAFSTIAQMGFMLLQCGLGAFGLALAHIVAHSLYKAYTFLTAGSTIGAVPRAAVRLDRGAISLGALTGSLIVAALAVGLSLVAGSDDEHAWVFTVLLGLSLSYGLARLWSVSGPSRSAVGGLGVAFLLGLIGLGLHVLSMWLVPVQPTAPAALGVQLAAAVVFVSLFTFQLLLWRTGRLRLGRVLYVHALNGFYVSTYANRLLARLWPRRSRTTQQPIALPEVA